MVSVGRSNFNTANSAARSVKAEIEGMQKTLTQIGAVMADEPAAAREGEEGRARLRSAAHREPGEDQARSAAEHREDLPRRLLPPARRRRRQAVQLLLRLDRALRRGRAAHQEDQGRRRVAEGVRREVGARARPRRTTASCSTTAGQADRRQPGRDWRSGLQGRRQGLPRRRHDRASRSARTPARRGSIASRAPSSTSATSFR